MNLYQYIRYIQNTGLVPLPSEYFDDDYAPIGHVVRAQLVEEGLVTETDEGLTLTEKAMSYSA